ncbi:hypothetical protein D3C71_1909280 [compost metagenome]
MLQRLHHAIGGSFWHIDQAMQLGKGHFLMLLAKRQQQLQSAIQSWDQIFTPLVVCHVLLLAN